MEDRILVWKFKRGSREALQRIYEKYRNDLLGITAELLHDTNLAEDIVHEVFAVFVERINEFKLTGSLKGYLTVCAANKARNLNRANFRQQPISIDDIDPPVSKFKRPDQWMIFNEQSKQLTDALALLPYEQKETVILHIQGNMKFKEIARLQKTSIKTIQSRYRYGLNKLRSIMNDEVTK